MNKTLFNYLKTDNGAEFIDLVRDWNRTLGECPCKEKALLYAIVNEGLCNLEGVFGAKTEEDAPFDFPMVRFPWGKDAFLAFKEWAKSGYAVGILNYNNPDEVAEEQSAMLGDLNAGNN